MQPDACVECGGTAARYTPPPAELPIASSRFEWSVALFSTWFVVGLYSDGWAHIRELAENFFTPWHAILYTGVLGVAGTLALSAWHARQQGHPWARALPAGYGLSAWGIFVFAIAGGLDLLWHNEFGIEVALEALYSPPHLMLATGGVLITTGPLRGAWQAVGESVGARWRAVLSATLLLAIITFFTSESHPVVHPWSSQEFRPKALDAEELALPSPAAGGLGTRDLTQMLGIAGIVLQSAALMGTILLLVRRWGSELPLGWLTLTLAAGAAGGSIFHSTWWAATPALCAGIAADILYLALKPRAERTQRMRVFGIGVPAVFYAGYFVTLIVTGGVWWSLPLWTGGIFLAGAVGLLVSYLVFPPPWQSEPERCSTERSQAGALATEAVSPGARNTRLGADS
jgi:hypothetical protein